MKKEEDKPGAGSYWSKIQSTSIDIDTFSFLSSTNLVHSDIYLHQQIFFSYLSFNEFTMEKKDKTSNKLIFSRRHKVNYIYLGKILREIRESV